MTTVARLIEKGDYIEYIHHYYKTKLCGYVLEVRKDDILVKHPNSWEPNNTSWEHIIKVDKKPCDLKMMEGSEP